MPAVAPAGPTVAHVPPADGGATGTYAAPASGFDVELRQLLRLRLIRVLLLRFTFLGLLGVLSLFRPVEAATRPDRGNPLNLLGPLAQSLIGAVVLWRVPGMSLRSLRLWELFHFATNAIYSGMLRFVLLATVAADDPNPLQISVAFRGVVTLTGFITLILAYGVLIPNTRRRSLIVVLALAVVPFLAAGAAVLANPLLRSHLLPLSVQAALTLTFPAGTAIFAATRAAALQRRAYEAEKRANEIGQYALKQKLGEGGMGEVWLAEHRLLKRPCAVKFIRPDLAANPMNAARFAREVQAVTALDALQHRADLRLWPS